jgi:hypothetical protein
MKEDRSIPEEETGQLEPKEEVKDSKDSVRQRIECPRCGEDSQLVWILNKPNGLCSSCWNCWLLNESS